MNSCLFSLNFFAYTKSPEGIEIAELLLTVKERRRQVAEYALEFRMLTTGSGWSETALKVVFHQDLNPEIFTELACHDDQVSFKSFNICI